MAEHGGDLGAHQVEQCRETRFRCHRGEPLDEPGVGLGRGTTSPRPDQAAQQRADLAVLAQRREIEPQRQQHRVLTGDRRVEQRQSLLHRQRRRSASCHAFGVGLRQHAGLVPRAPRQRHRGQSGGSSVLGQSVEERVGRRVVRLPGGTERPGSAGEEDEPVQILRELVQVPGRVDLGPQHGRQPLRRERLDHAVVQHTGRVHDAANLVLLQHLLQRLAVTDIARDHRDLGVHIGHICLAGTADQHEILDAVPFDEVLRDHPPQPTGTAGDEHRPGELAGFGRFGTREPCREHLATTHPQLRLVDRENLLGHLGVGVDEREPAGVLVLRGPHQAVHRARGQVVLTRHEHQPFRALLSDPPLHQVQRTRSKRMRLLNDIPVADELLHHHGGRTGLGQRHRRPVEPEQRVALHGADLPRRHRPRHQRPDRRHRHARRVRDRDPPRVTVAAQPHPNLGRTGRVQRHALPRERQTRLGPVEEAARVQGGVEQRRVQPERSTVHTLGQRDLGEHLAVPAPHRPQPLEHRPVLEPVLREPLVGPFNLNGLSAGRRPHRRVEVAAGRATRQEPGRVPRPRHVLIVGPGEHLDRATPVLLGTDRDLQPHGTLCGQHERRGQRQLVDAVEPGLVPGPHRELQERRPRQQHLPEHRVIREPRVRAQRQPARAEIPVRTSDIDRRPEQRVLDPREPQRPDIAGLAHRPRPEHLVLERVGGQIDLPPARVQPHPINIDSVNMYLTECSQH